MLNQSVFGNRLGGKVMVNELFSEAFAARLG